MTVTPDAGPIGPSPCGDHDPEQPRRGRSRRGFGIGIRLAAAASAGLGLYASFPPIGVWILAPVAIAMFVATVRGQSARAGACYGMIMGLALFLPLLPWVGEYVGAAPWLALATIQALFVAIFGATVDRLSRLRFGFVWIACAWVAMEAIRSRIPFGGFPWGRIAFGQADGPLLPLASLAGAPGLSFVVVMTGSAMALFVVSGRGRRVACLGSTVAVAAVTVAAPYFAPAAQERITVASIQGNVPRSGLDFNSQRRAVLDNHVQRTIELAAEVRSGRVDQPDLVIWPENSSDIDPLRNLDAAQRIDEAAQAIGVPILVGAVLQQDDGTSRNTSIVWDPETGPGQEHDKRQLVPFGEYLPLRPLVTALAPFAAQAGNFIPGDGNGVVDLAGVRLAVATCYEVAFDPLLTESVRAGASLIAVPTNNATFGRTNMTYQQLAMSRVRAVEHGRPVVVAATSGVSAVIDARGSISGETELFTSAAVVTSITLGTGLTPATVAGDLPQWIATASALLALGYSLRRTPTPAPIHLSTTMQRSS
ncbi:apolipoprotein N-acyltransferase [Rhodococcus sp. BP-252]|uniref:apolipoprotein N-acyltransferase n=1 Tax=Nocardiaceae TaxID=85025 RepID=UPI000A07490B|nr:MULTISPECIES: apolipoprotein N-acyltransferase [Rhodococcus]MBY6413950.1 apolipoprotein N-acyltransferase [Rhodococcus sp. BP-320]MBY6418600.1 apolipoprotein N-acyltransferase [Rhodococcus sp. BP-321]MBY6422895.1 apolipoprotein N-acyltransferase [Rhodococcus sp. BP-324]MBY6428756.1 apolipoprotein N-acyltransferase [Rhodococcus sp. BP-323]MBY6433721.1 apolipoprotein N-acyltransferase [Rhodococcus sp. BP-322]